MKPFYQRGDVEHQHAEGIVRLEVESAPVRVIEHQLDIRALGNHVKQPGLVSIVAEDLIVERACLRICDAIEIDVV